jgi:hypothetical protein
MTEKCKIFLLGSGDGINEVIEEINALLSRPGVKKTQVLQSSMATAQTMGHVYFVTHLTIFYTEEED